MLSSVATYTSFFIDDHGRYPCDEVIFGRIGDAFYWPQPLSRDVRCRELMLHDININYSLRNGIYHPCQLILSLVDCSVRLPQYSPRTQ